MSHVRKVFFNGVYYIPGHLIDVYVYLFSTFTEDINLCKVFFMQKVWNARLMESISIWHLLWARNYSRRISLSSMGDETASNPFRSKINYLSPGREQMAIACSIGKYSKSAHACDINSCVQCNFHVYSCQVDLACLFFLFNLIPPSSLTQLVVQVYINENIW